MHRTELRVRGSAVDELPSTLHERLLGERKGSVGSITSLIEDICDGEEMRVETD